MSNTQQVHSGNFQTEILNHKGLALVDFWAVWCGPCKMLSPIVDELAGEFNGKVKIVGLDVDESSDVAAQYGIQAIPTLLLFKDGKVIEQMVGLQPKDTLRKKLEKAANPS